MSMARFVIGIDVGGTFTDVLAYDEIEGRLLSAKVPSMPGAQWQGVLEALAALKIELSTVRAFVHGTTIATNALLERKGAKTALVTTAGFRDVLEIGKGRRLTGGLFDTTWQRPPPLVPRDRRYQDVLGIDVALDPEAAADFRGDHAHVFLCRAEHARDGAPHRERHLGREPDGKKARCRIV